MLATITNSKVSCLYLRVSAQDQNTESQERALRDWCAKQGVMNFELFTDHGISGAKESRPALNQLMERVEKGDVEQVIVFSFSRFARSVSHLLKALEKFKSKQIRFISVTEQAVEVADPFHVVQSLNRAIDDSRKELAVGSTLKVSKRKLISNMQWILRYKKDNLGDEQLASLEHLANDFVPRGERICGDQPFRVWSLGGHQHIQTISAIQAKRNGLRSGCWIADIDVALDSPGN